MYAHPIGDKDHKVSTDSNVCAYMQHLTGFSFLCFQLVKSTLITPRFLLKMFWVKLEEGSR